MPFCPLCRTEYRSGFTVCSDCQVELVDFIHQETAKDEQRLKRLPNLKWTYFQSVLNDFEADVIAGLLETNNIPTLRKYPGSSGYAKIYLGSSFGVELYVPDDQFQDARALLFQAQHEANQDGEE